ncbi:MAG: 3-oxoacyl-ACP reductase FabG [Oligoflexia bacterium]|nr:3-oxoacyl-ACP reductase FabG [Oligoflexia bacterium]
MSNFASGFNFDFDFDFSGQHVLITGGTRGIGLGITRSFINANANVITTYLNNESAKDSLLLEYEQLQSQSPTKGKLEVIKCDVSKEEEVKNLYSHLENSYPSLEILINNAGIKRDSIVGTMSSDNWHEVINTNLNAVFYTSKLAVLSFLKNRYGRIINIGSVGGKLGLAGQANYSATKAALIGFSKSLSKEVAKKGITVNVVEPGFIDTDFVAELSNELKESYKQMVPLRRFGKIEEVAYAVLCLANKNASYITGTTLEVSGGLS